MIWAKWMIHCTVTEAPLMLNSFLLLPLKKLFGNQGAKPIGSKKEMKIQLFSTDLSRPTYEKTILVRFSLPRVLTFEMKLISRLNLLLLTKISSLKKELPSNFPLYRLEPHPCSILLLEALFSEEEIYRAVQDLDTNILGTFLRTMSKVCSMILFEMQLSMLASMKYT